MASNNVFTLTDENFQAEVLNCAQPVLVDFWAPWCGPCRMVAPIIDELAGEYVGRLKIGKLNTDENQHIPTHYQIRGVPTFLLFKGGKVVTQIVGARPKGELKAMLDQALA